MACSLSFASSLYKWRDSDGVLHFSNIAPGEGAKNIEESAEAKGSDYASTERKTTSSPAKKQNRSQASESSSGKMSRSDCSRTVKLIKEGAEINIKTAKKNLSGGYITRDQYNKARSAMLQIKNEVSVSDCMNATGKDKKIYDCLNDSYGYIPACIEVMK